MLFREGNLPVHSRKFWGLLLSIFTAVMVLTMLKDWWLTEKAPNILFYIFVPPLSILGGVLSMVAVARISRQATTFLTLLAISVGANTVMQVVEIIMKMIYYLLWEYPGLLYIVVVIPLGFLLLAYGLVRWGNVKWWLATMMTIADFIRGMAIGILLTDVIGITTPGS